MAGIELTIGEGRMHELAEKGEATMHQFGNVQDYLATVGNLTYVLRSGDTADSHYALLNPEKYVNGGEKK